MIKYYRRGVLHRYRIILTSFLILMFDLKYLRVTCISCLRQLLIILYAPAASNSNGKGCLCYNMVWHYVCNYPLLLFNVNQPSPILQIETSLLKYALRLANATKRVHRKKRCALFTLKSSPFFYRIPPTKCT